jgi:Zn-dependent protease with chaperone function
MRSARKPLFPLLGYLLIIVLGLALPVRVSAQRSPGLATGDAGDDDDKPVSFLYVTLDIDGQGQTEAMGRSFVVDGASIPTSDIKQALQSAIGCSLKDSGLRGSLPGYYAGSCVAPAADRGLLHGGLIHTDSLTILARSHDIPSLSLQLNLPDSEVIELHPPLGTFESSGKMSASVARILRRRANYRGTLDSPLPSEIAFRYGYSSGTLKRSAGVFALTLLSPLALLIWLGRKALSAEVQDKAIVWFSYMRSLGWILNGSLLAWWIALEDCHAESLLRFLFSGTRFSRVASHPAAFAALSWFPPAVLWLLCYRLSHPVQQRLRGLHWTKRELTLQALYSVLAGLFPLAMFLTGLNVIPREGFRGAVIWWISAFLLRLIAGQSLLKVTGMQPQALSSGDLRDNAFRMAERLGVKLQQVYVLPSGRGQMANAFARTGNTISFTDLLLGRMSRRETDFVLAHELTHLKLKHPAKLGYAYGAGIAVAMYVSSYVSLFLHDAPLARYVLVFSIISVFGYFWSRRFEYAADAGAVAATSDPRAAISALCKLAELNMMPMHWSKWREKWLTHPSSMRRAQAIAKKAGIPFEEIPAIVRDAAAETARYSIPATAAAGGKIHSTERTKARRLKASLALIGLFAFVPALFSLAAIHSSSPLKWTLFAAAVPATFFAFLIFSNYVQLLFRTDNGPSLRKKLASQGIDASSWGGVFVGFAPSASTRVYEGNVNWDIGYLFFRPDRLCYCGEETKFSLRQSQITAIKLSDGLPSFLPTRRIYVAWKDDDRGTCGVIHFGCGRADSVFHAARLNADLARRLQAWWNTPPAARPLPKPLAELTSPAFRTVTSHSLAETWKPRRIFKELLWTAIFSAAGAILCGLPFHLLPYLTMRAYTSPGAGWYAVAVAVFVRLIALMPFIRHRDAPELVAELPAQRAIPATPLGSQESSAPDLEKVPVG